MIAACAVLVLLLASCSKIDYKSFVGTWGVEKLEYYNIDFAGNPIAGSMTTYNYVPGDAQSGMDLIFREDKTGEMRDRSRDTLKFDYDTISHTYQTVIICPDTTLVSYFTYSFDDSESILYMNMQSDEYVRTYKMNIVSFSKNSFVYENEYGKDYVEKAYLKRVSNSTSKSASKSKPIRPHKPGSFWGDR